MRNGMVGFLVVLCCGALLAGGCAKKEMVKGEEAMPAAAPAKPSEQAPTLDGRAYDAGTTCVQWSVERQDHRSLELDPLHRTRRKLRVSSSVSRMSRSAEIRAGGFG